jgi:thioredoxin 1
MEQLAAEYEGKVRIAGMDANDNYETATRYGLMAIPTLLFFKDGKEVARIVGPAKKETLAEEIRRHFGV